MTPLITARHNGVPSFIELGDQISVEFPDGKGVSGTFAGVDIEPGGEPFRLVVTHDGEKPNARSESVCDEVSPDRGEVTPEREPRELPGELTRLRMELELSRDRTQEVLGRWHASANRVEGLVDALTKARGERDEAIYRADQLDTELRSLHEQRRTFRLGDVINVYVAVPEGDAPTDTAGH